MSASEQNNVRLRIFLILVLSIIIRIIRTQASTSVHKASGILETNYFIYGLVMVCSLLPFKSAWVVAFIGNIIGTILDTSALTLAMISTWRCKEQVGCVQTMPFSIVVLIFIFGVAIFDILQTWSIYQILSGPMTVTSATQRIRILFAWAFPFAYLVNFKLMINSIWTPLVTPHLVGDTLIILMANSGENTILLVVMITLIVFDGLAMLALTDTLVLKAIYVQIALTIGGIFVFLGATVIKKEEVEKTKSTRPLVVPAFENSEAGTTLTKRRKSKKLHF